MKPSPTSRRTLQGLLFGLGLALAAGGWFQVRDAEGAWARAEAEATARLAEADEWLASFDEFDKRSLEAFGPSFLRNSPEAFEARHKGYSSRVQSAREEQAAKQSAADQKRTVGRGMMVLGAFLVGFALLGLRGDGPGKRSGGE